MPPEFKNRENERVETRDGRQIWVSRACAVIAEVCMYNPADRQWYVLLAKRGSETPDCRGMWGLPCGYLDWDETLRDAVVREVWEECGLYLPELPQQPGFAGSSSGFFRTGEDSADTPWRIYDTPDNSRQNLGFHYAIPFVWNGDAFPQLSNANVGPGETEALDWVGVQRAMSMQLAFNHQHAISRLFEEKKQLFVELAGYCG